MDEAYRMKVVCDYVRYCVNTKDVKVTTFHNRFHPYRRKQSTIDLIKKAREREIIFAPRIFCLQDTEVYLVEYENIPLLDLYERTKESAGVYYIMALSGAYSLIYFKRGKRNLTYVTCTNPSYPALVKSNEIDITMYKKEKLPEMFPPGNWDELDWRIYTERKDPTRSSVKIGENLGVTFTTVMTRYKKILKDCGIWIPFFPNGYSKYIPYVITLRTDYETGILSELKKLDRSSYVYKFEETLILTLFFDGHLEIDSFLKLHKKGLIHDLRVSYPLRSNNVFWSDWYLTR